MSISQTSFQQFALLGSGRVARHFAHYFKLLQLPFLTWSRSAFRSPQDSQRELMAVVERSTHVLLAVSDSAIASVAEPLHQSGRVLVHLSGALTVPGVRAAHPLMTFGENLGGLDWYRAIPFAIDAGTHFSELLPGLPNQAFGLPTGDKALYHALCSLAGNSSYLLWRRVGDEFERLGLPRELLRAFLHQVVENALQNGSANFTGPVARGDWNVVRAHERALSESVDLSVALKSYLQMAHNVGVALPEDLL